MNKIALSVENLTKIYSKNKTKRNHKQYSRQKDRYIDRHT